MIVITGATGHLGQLVLEEFVNAGVPAGQIVAAVRSPEKAGHLKAQGFEVRQADYTKPETLRSAFQGAERVLLISSNEVGNDRVGQHKAVIDAAKAAGVKLLAYTSIVNADWAKNLLAADHQTTEAYLRESGVPYTMLRNGWYFENHTAALQPALEHGAILGAAKDGRFAAAARRDYAAAAAAVLAGQGHENKVYELAGEAPYTLDELAAEVSRQAGKPVMYRDLSEEEYAAALAGFGLPEAAAQAIASADVGAIRGELTTDSQDLRRLLGRPAVTMQEAVRSALQTL